MTIKKRVALHVFVLILLIGIKGFSQSSSDTIRISKKLVDIVQEAHYGSENDSYRINGKIVEKEEFSYIVKKFDSIRDVLDKNIGNYFIFLGSDGKVVEEGWWYIEFFSGYYKSYFASGAIKEEGYYIDACDSTFFPGQKTGKWKYYTKGGTISKIIIHSPTIRRKYNESDPPLPPCLCSQKMLYTDKNCTSFPARKQKGITYHYSSSLLRKKYLYNEEIKNDSLLELKFLVKYGSQFMDSVFSKKECINDGVFVINIFEHNPKDTFLAFSMSYVKTLNRLENVLENILRKDYLILKGRKVIVKYSHDLQDDVLHAFLPEIKLPNEDFSQYVQSPQTMDPYRGRYVLHGDKIEATFIYPYYVKVPAEEQIW